MFLDLFFTGIDDSYWKIRMTWFLKFIHYNFWYVIQNGSHIPKKIENGITIPKSSQEQGDLDKKKVELNVRAIQYLHCAIVGKSIIVLANVICQEHLETFKNNS